MRCAAFGFWSAARVRLQAKRRSAFYRHRHFIPHFENSCRVPVSEIRSQFQPNKNRFFKFSLSFRRDYCAPYMNVISYSPYIALNGLASFRFPAMAMPFCAFAMLSTASFRVLFAEYRLRALQIPLTCLSKIHCNRTRLSDL
jgi:hypothetical protein